MTDEEILAMSMAEAGIISPSREHQGTPRAPSHDGQGDRPKYEYDHKTWSTPQEVDRLHLHLHLTPTPTLTLMWHPTGGRSAAYQLPVQYP